jgi:histidinol-phosphate aminotransferase
MIRMVMSSVLAPGDHAVLLSPTFLLYKRIAGLLSAQIHEVAAIPDEDFALPIDELVVRARTNEAKMVALCAPNNPTGTVYTLDQIRHVVDESGALVVVDEAYAEFSGTDMCALLEEFDNVILLRTFSKAFAMAGLRVGYAITAPHMAAALGVNIDPFPISTLSETAALVALENLDHFMGNVARIVAERERLATALSAMPNVHVYSSGANFVLVQFDHSPQALVDGLANGHGIMISDVAAYPELPNTVRISMGLPEANDTVIDAVRGFVENS